MAFDSKVMDELNWKILELLQKDARIPFSELGRQVGLSAPATAERVRRMEDAGIIAGYRTVLDPSKLGYSLEVFIRLSCQGSKQDYAIGFISELPQVLEFWNLTGEDGYVLRVVLRSVHELDTLLKKLAVFGGTITSLVLSKPVDFRVMTGEDEETQTSNQGGVPR